jgi:truncated hemoglobin YjbI
MYKLTVKNKLYSYEKIGTYEELTRLLEDFYVSMCEVTIVKLKD